MMILPIVDSSLADAVSGEITRYPKPTRAKIHLDDKLISENAIPFSYAEDKDGWI
jgi:hypothetical protein